jgi:hypothetical protein
MFMRINPIATAVAVTLVSTTFLLATPAVRAAGPYDGVWQIDIPQSGALEEGGFACGSARIQVQVRDNVVSGTLKRGGTGSVETGSTGPSAAPVSGNVSANGKLTAKWQGYTASGQLSGNTGRLTVQRMCGRVTATATRAAS